MVAVLKMVLKKGSKTKEATDSYNIIFGAESWSTYKTGRNSDGG